jgi:hypothetical protein
MVSLSAHGNLHVPQRRKVAGDGETARRTDLTKQVAVAEMTDVDENVAGLRTPSRTIVEETPDLAEMGGHGGTRAVIPKLTICETNPANTDVSLPLPSSMTGPRDLAPLIRDASI